MKKIILTIYLLTSLYSMAQTLPLEQYNDLTGNLEDNAAGITYIKDVNGVLNKFVGTWKGSFDGKQLEIVVKKYTRDISQAVKSYHPVGLKWDQLIAKIKLTDQNGVVTYNTLNFPDDSPSIMYKKAYRNPYTYSFYYEGKNSQCGDNGFTSIYIKKNTQDTKAYLVYLHRGEQSPSCQTSIDPVFPNDQGILLTKQ